MIKVVTLYKSDGSIQGVLSCPDEYLAQNVPHDCEYIEGGFDGDEYYIRDGAARPKQEMSPTVSGLTVTGLPIPCTAIVEGLSYTVTDGEFEFSSNLPGPYAVLFRALAYKDWTGTLS